MRTFFLLLKIIFATVLIAAAWMIRTPSTVELRPWLLLVVIAAALVVMAASLRWRRWARGAFSQRAELAPFLLAALALIVAVTMEGQFQLARRSVLAAEPAALERLGRHIVVGYSDPATVRELVERRAIAGVFLTQRNAANRDAASIAREIGKLQSIRSRQGLPPLWIATDQEGGVVSRLSPPLVRQPPLATLVREWTSAAPRNPDALRSAVAAYAAEQARGLAALGVNLNFAPVVDLNFNVRNPNDSFTHIAERAIAADAGTVSDVAGWYCEGLMAHGVRCTLKHFPGLGRVFDDTHRRDATLNASPQELANADWIPFRRLLGHADSFVMVGHVRLKTLDATQPASTSASIVNGLLRGEWGYSGIVITDDLCMGAIDSSLGGIAGASKRALNAGVDLLLLSWDGDQIYPVLASLLPATDLEKDWLQQSDRRLHTAQAKLIGK